MGFAAQVLGWIFTVLKELLDYYSCFFYYTRRTLTTFHNIETFTECILAYAIARFQNEYHDWLTSNNFSAFCYTSQHQKGKLIAGLFVHYSDDIGVPNHWRLDCLLNRLFTRRSRKTLNLRVTGLCEGNQPVSGGFPTQRAASNQVKRKIISFHDVTMDSCLLITTPHCLANASREYIDGSAQNCSNSITNALELLQSCTKQLIRVLGWVVRYTWFANSTNHSSRMENMICKSSRPIDAYCKPSAYGSPQGIYIFR